MYVLYVADIYSGAAGARFRELDTPQEKSIYQVNNVTISDVHAVFIWYYCWFLLQECNRVCITQ